MNHSQRTTWQRLMALFLSLCLVLNGTPAPAWAEEPASEPVLEAAEDASDPDVGLSAEASEVTVSVVVSVVNDDGTLETWIPKTSVKVAEGATAWDAIKQVLDDYKKKGGDYQESYGFVTSITSTDKVTKTQADDYSVYWQFLVNDAYSSTGVGNTSAQSGDVYELRFAAENTASNPEDVEPDDLTKEPEDLPADWATFENEGNVTKAPTPTEVSVNWKTLVGYVSEPLIVDGKVYVATSSLGMGSSNNFDNTLQLLRIDEATGQIEAMTPLAGTISYTSRPTYHKGMIYIPLDGGQIQAINVSTMKTRWVSAAPENGGQAQTSLKVIETDVFSTDSSMTQISKSLKDVLFSGTIKYGADNKTTGGVLALDALTGTLEKSLMLNLNDAGFSWTNFVSVKGQVITGDTAGRLYAISAGYSASEYYGTTYYKLSASYPSIDLGAAINADLAVYKDNTIVVPTRDGVLHLVTVADDGSLTEAYKQPILSACTAGATIVGNLALIAGRALSGTGSAVVVYDLDAHKVVRTITKADGQTLPGGEWDYLKSPVLVSVQGGKTYGYFTSNYGENQNGVYVSGGNAYWFELGEDEAHLLYEPTGEVVNVSDSPLIADSTGALYYLNDSGYLVRLTTDISAADKEPELTLDEASTSIMALDHTATLTFEQEIPADATSIELWCDLPEVLEFASDDVAVLVDGKEYATVEPLDNQVKITIEGDAAIALRPSAGDPATEAASDDDALVAQADESESATTAKKVSLVFDAKVADGADLSSFEKDGVYVVPVTAYTCFNQDEARTYSATKSLKLAKTGQKDKGTTPAPKAAKANGSLAKTGDETSSTIVVALVGAAAATLVVALVLRKRKA